ncbi:MAG: hypothetical protein ABIS06_09735 [Vicinamibacterales bacterium]
MKMPLRGRSAALLVVFLFVFQWSLTAQTPGAAQRPLTYDVVDYWQSIGGTRVSDDGQWVVYSVTSQAVDGELIVRNLRTSQEFKHPRGTGAQFTADGTFVIFTIAQTKDDEERERIQNRAAGRGEGAAAEGAAPAAATPPSTPAEPQAQTAAPGGRPGGGARSTTPRTGLGIMSLADGKVTTIDRVGSFRLADESAAYLAYYKGTGVGGGGGAALGGRGGGGGRGAGAPQAGAAAGAANARTKQPGSDLVLRNLATAEEVTIPEVTEYAWNQKGSWLAYTASSNDATKDGAFARRISDGAVTTLFSGKGRYRSLSFDEAGSQIVFLSDTAEFDKNPTPYRVYYWKGGEAKATELVSASTSGMPKGMGITDSAAPRFSRDGARIFLATAPPAAAPADPKDPAPAPIAVDLWSTKDQMLQPMQRVRGEQERNRNYRAVYHLAGKKFVQLATPELPTVTPGEDIARAIGTSDLSYRMEVSWDQSYNDVFLLDLKTGKANRVLEHWGSNATSMSPGGKYVLYFEEATGNWHTYRVPDGARVNLTDKINVRFQQSNDVPDLPGAFGVAGWTADDKSVLLYDQFDIWEMKPDGGTARNVTGGEGRKAQLALRYLAMDPQERVIPTNKPLLLSATDDRTRATGFYRLANLTATTPPEKVVMLDKAFGTVNKAKSADTVVFTLSRFEDFPDIWTSDLTFKDMKKVSNVGAQQAQFTWGKSELIEYINADGKKLRAILTKPDNFDPNKKYPLMVYIYEELTQGLHSYNAPNVGDQHQHPPLPQQRLRHAAAGHRLHNGLPGRGSRKMRDPGRQRARDHGVHRSEADRDPGAFMGRLPDHAPDHAYQPLCRR